MLIDFRTQIKMFTFRKPKTHMFMMLGVITTFNPYFFTSITPFLQQNSNNPSTCFLLSSTHIFAKNKHWNTSHVIRYSKTDLGTQNKLLLSKSLEINLFMNGER